MSSTEECISDTIWSLDSYDESIDVQYHPVTISVLSVLWISKWCGRLLQLTISWKFNEPAFIYTQSFTEGPVMWVMLVLCCFSTTALCLFCIVVYLLTYLHTHLGINKSGVHIRMIPM